MLMEDIILRKMRSFIGWKDEGEGIFTPGTFIYKELVTFELNVSYLYLLM